ncbi:MAG TPA: ABC transporter permease [Terriglobia bacterium]|nr:ABC transporter permease [Terriglobia bacterium]
MDSALTKDGSEKPSIRSDDIPVFDIRPTSGWRLLDVRELWSYRELVYFLTWRDIKVRYKQTALGVIWVLLQPVAMMALFTIVFRRVSGVSPDGIPYSIFTLTALLPWQLFSRAITDSTTSLVTDQKLITRVYFPRIIVPISTVLAAIVDFLIASILLLAIVVYYGIPLHAQIIWTPVFFVLMIVAALGTGFWLSALNVEYRDVSHTIPFLNQFWFFLTPIVYSSSIVPDRWRFLYSLNPMTGVVEGFRWSILGTAHRPDNVILPSVAVAIVLLISGTVWFRRRERTFVDIIGSGSA